MAEIDNVELKKRSRRRLVGAAALALLAAIVLPMVMDHEPTAPVQDIQVTIPEHDSDSGAVRPSAGHQASVAEPQVAPAPEEQPPSAGAAEPPRPVAESLPARPAILPAPPAKMAETPPAKQPVVKPESAKPETPKPFVQAPSPQQADDATRAKEILEGKSAAVAVPGSSADAFVVQIGAFADAAKAASVVSDLKKRGFAAYTEKVGAMTRVRLGPYRGREDADRAAQRARAGGVSGTVMPR